MTATLLAVHAHPDDESILTGGVLARAAAEGRRAAVVTCTGGEQGEVVGAGFDPAAVQPRLAEVRAGELARALEILGAEPPRLLGYRDSGMAGEPTNDDPRCFWQAHLDEAVGRLVRHIRELRPDVIVTYDAFGNYGHPDHVQAHRVTVVAVEAAGYPALYPEAGAPWRTPKVYFATLPRPVIVVLARHLAERGLPAPFSVADRVEDLDHGAMPEEITATVDVRSWLERKIAALRSHATQLGPESFFLNVPDEIVEVAFGTEWFVRHRSDVDAPAVEDDLFAGLAP